MNNSRVRSGQTTLTLLIIMVLLIILTTAAVALTVTTNRDTTRLGQGEEASTIAQTGLENAILRLLRDPSYPGEADLPVDGGSATIQVTGTTTKVITSTGTLGRYTRIVQAEISTVNGVLTISNWQQN